MWNFWEAGTDFLSQGAMLNLAVSLETVRRFDGAETHGIAQGTGHSIKDGGLQQESLNAIGLLFQDLLDQVVQYIAVAAGKRLDECGGIIVLFRSRSIPFDEASERTVDALRSIFAEQISSILRVHRRALPVWPDEAIGGEDDDYGFGDLAA